MFVIIISGKGRIHPAAIGPFENEAAVYRYLESEVGEIARRGFRIDDDDYGQTWVEGELVFSAYELDTWEPGSLLKVVNNQPFAQQRKH